MIKIKESERLQRLVEECDPGDIEGMRREFNIQAIYEGGEIEVPDAVQVGVYLSNALIQTRKKKPKAEIYTATTLGGDGEVSFYFVGVLSEIIDNLPEPA